MDKISSILTNWYPNNKRNLPWRHSKSAYKIWLSEIIMQQTQVIQGTPYYLKFVNEFPTIQDLASASEEKIMAMWQGLGYYSRARNLHFTAKLISDRYNGDFPSNPKDIIKLKGIGTYTCAAISTFAFDNPLPLVDGNVYRLFSRLFEIPTPINTPKGNKQFFELAEEFLKIQTPESAIIFNQAIMEFGALVCKPKKPECQTCPLSHKCLAFKNNSQLEFPKKIKPKKKEEREMHYLFIYSNKGLWVNQRKEKDIWQGLNEFHLLKDRGITFTIPEKIVNQEITDPPLAFKHILSHQNINISIQKLKIDDHIVIENKWLQKWDEIDDIGFPKPMAQYIKDIKINMSII